jgi:DNA-3-methyladenine glycosylase I
MVPRSRCEIAASSGLSNPGSAKGRRIFAIARPPSSLLACVQADPLRSGKDSHFVPIARKFFMTAPRPDLPRCPWCGTQDALYVRYHDTEWGVPEYDSRALWEKLILDGFQAGLSWITILRKRDAFRTAFAGFDPDLIATWGEAEVERLLQDPGIVRHRGKIEATITNARAWQAMEARGGFDAYMWDHVGGRPKVGGHARQADVPTSDALSTQISKDMKKAGFKFCGPTIVYAWMEATGLFNNHLTGCFRHEAVKALAR